MDGWKWWWGSEVNVPALRFAIGRGTRQRTLRRFRRRQEVRVVNTVLPQSITEPLTLITNWPADLKQ